MAAQRPGHLQIAYVPDEEQAAHALPIKAAALCELGRKVHVSGSTGRHAD